MLDTLDLNSIQDERARQSMMLWLYQNSVLELLGQDFPPTIV